MSKSSEASVIHAEEFHMDAAYPGRGIVSGKNRKLFEAWSNLHPADRWECQRAKEIEQIQGNENKVVKQACAKAGL